MRLKDYLTQRGIGVGEFAEKLGITRFYLSGLLHGRVPGKLTLKNIHHLTLGEVTKEDFLKVKEEVKVKKLEQKIERQRWLEQQKSLENN